MRISDVTSPVYQQIGETIVRLADEYIENGVLRDFSGSLRETPPAREDLGQQLVPPARVVLTDESMAHLVLDYSRNEYMKAQRDRLRNKSFEIDAISFYRFMSIFDRDELSRICRRHSALANTSNVLVHNFNVIFPQILLILRRKVDEAPNRFMPDALTVQEREMVDRLNSISRRQVDQSGDEGFAVWDD